MAIHINDMAMPTNCGDCPCASIFRGYRCRVNKRVFDKYPLDHRQDWCPLEEVPEIPNHLRCRCGGKLSERRYDQVKGKYYRHCGSCNFEFYEEAEDGKAD